MQLKKPARGHTIYFKNMPKITATGTVAGPKECAGIVGQYVDRALENDMFGESTFEKAECKMLRCAIDCAIENAGLARGRVDALFSGDLLNQIISASFAARDFEIPFLGVYSACSTMSDAGSGRLMMCVPIGRPPRTGTGFIWIFQGIPTSTTVSGMKAGKDITIW